MTIHHKASKEAKEDKDIEDDDRILVLKGKTFSEVDSYIDTTIVDLATTKAFLKVLAKIILYLVKKS